MLALDVKQWAEQNFGSCELGDIRRTRRAVIVAAQMARDPSASAPDQMEEWSDCKATYGLFNEEDVSFQALGEPHWRQTRAHAQGVRLIINDTTSTDFGIHREVSGLGPTGNGGGRGFLLHSGLFINARDESTDGLGGQVLEYRRPVPKGEKRSQRLKRKRESEIWGQLIDQIGAPPEESQWIHVCDRGADDFQVYCKCLLNRCDWVIRARYLNRNVRNPNGEKMSLRQVLARCPTTGTYDLSVRKNKDQPARTAKLEVRFGTFVMPAPTVSSPFVKGCGIVSIAMQVVEVREVNTPAGCKPLQWVLLTSLPVPDFETAWNVIEYYEKRPLIEEFHRALKTGCRLESRQYRTNQPLEALTAISSVLAVRLLQIRSIARTDPTRAAQRVVPARWLELLERIRGGKRKPLNTVYDFFRALGQLGGHLGRKSDGEPGWITLWRGLEKLLLIERGADIQRKKCG